MWHKCDLILPEFDTTVWVSNPEKNWVGLGCRVVTSSDEDLELTWCWAVHIDGSIYIDSGKIVAECEVDDWDITMWHHLPEPPKKKQQ